MADQTRAEIETNLLFAVLALQEEFIDRAQFDEVCVVWSTRTNQPLAELLLERGWITADDRAEIDRKMARKLKKHADDPHATLADTAEADVRDALRTIASPNVAATLDNLAPATGHRLIEALGNPSEQRSSLRYTLSRMHAQGGLGKVWIARDMDLNREVALKEIRIDRSANPDAWRRFMKEAQVTGQLEHPNIVPVYELARRKEDDQPFYTMRFVRGATFRGVIADFHKQDETTKNDRLSLQRHLLEPFIKICQAIGYAHSRGVIHRDLKPENVVIGNFGEVMVLDWGLAKVLDTAPASRGSAGVVAVSAEVDMQATQGACGTPAYMAPEQASGDVSKIGPHTDIYGLGGILYEILTGRPPAQGDTLPEILSKVTTGHIDPPRVVKPNVSKPLDAICAKALALRPEDRYATAEALAEDVRRWIVDEPVSVHRDPLPVIVMRWARRHRTLVSTVAGLLVTSVIALAVGIVLVDAERAKTETQRRRAVVNEKEATKNFQVALDAADTLLGEVADVDLAEIPQMESVRAMLLTKAQKRYEQFTAEKSDDPAIKAAAGRALARLGDIGGLLGNAQKAEKDYGRSIQTLESLRQAKPDDAELVRDLSRAYHGLGVLLKDEARHDPADDALRKAIALREALEKNHPDQAEAFALADSQYQLAALLARRGTPHAADAGIYQAAIDLVEKRRDAIPNRPEFKARRARFRNNQAILVRAMGQTGEASKIFQEILDELRPDALAPNPMPGPRWQYARAANNQAAILDAAGSMAEADKLLDEAISILRRLAEEYPDVLVYRQELAGALHNMGRLHLGKGDLADAETRLAEAVQLMADMAKDRPNAPSVRHRLAQFRLSEADALAQGNMAGAEKQMSQALGELEALVREVPDAVEYQHTRVRGLYQEARLLLSAKRFDDAIAAAKASLAAGKTLLERGPTTAFVRHTLTEAQTVIVRACLASDRLNDAIEAAEALPALDPVDAKAAVRGAVLLVRCGEHARASEDETTADESFKKAVTILARAQAQGLRIDPEDLASEDFDPVRTREDFQAVIDSVTAP